MLAVRRPADRVGIGPVIRDALSRSATRGDHVDLPITIEGDPFTVGRPVSAGNATSTFKFHQGSWRAPQRGYPTHAAGKAIGRYEQKLVSFRCPARADVTPGEPGREIERRTATQLAHVDVRREERTGRVGHETTVGRQDRISFEARRVGDPGLAAEGHRG